jgi:hypothetical protein
MGSIGEVFRTKGRTILTAALTTPFLVLLAQEYNELNLMSAFCGGYLNISVLRKISEGWLKKSPTLGN